MTYKNRPIFCRPTKSADFIVCLSSALVGLGPGSVVVIPGDGTDKRKTNVRDGAEVEDIGDAEVKFFCVRADVLEPVRPVKINVLDQQRIERVHVTNEDLIMLSRTQPTEHQIPVKIYTETFSNIMSGNRLKCFRICVSAWIFITFMGYVSLSFGILQKFQ